MEEEVAEEEEDRGDRGKSMHQPLETTCTRYIILLSLWYSSKVGEKQATQQIADVKRTEVE